MAVHLVVVERTTGNLLHQTRQYERALKHVLGTVQLHVQLPQCFQATRVQDHGVRSCAAVCGLKCVQRPTFQKDLHSQCPVLHATVASSRRLSMSNARVSAHWNAM